MQYDTKTLADLLLQRDRLDARIDRLQNALDRLPAEPENDLSPDDPVLVLALVKFDSYRHGKIYTYAFIKTPVGWYATGYGLNQDHRGQSWDELMEAVSNKHGEIVEMWQATDFNQLV